MSLGSKYLSRQIVKFKIQMVPNITLLLSYKNHSKININSIKFNHDMLAWATNENSKERFETNEVLWTLQCTEKYSKKIIDLYKKNKNKYIKELTKNFKILTGFKSKDLVFKNIHGWKYAYGFPHKSLNSFWLSKKKIGICADWLNGSKAEDAWTNARDLYFKIKKNPPKK